MTEARWTVPESWAWVTVADLGKVTGGATPSAREPTNFTDVGIPWITPADLTGYSEPYIARGRRDLSDKGYASCGATLMPAGTVLFSSRAPVGYCAIAANEITTNQGFKSVILADGVVPEYLRHYLLASKSYAESLASGTTFLELSGARFADLAVPLPPLSVQRRIVAKLDAVTARTARARADLGRIPSLAARYKLAILAAAIPAPQDQSRAFQEVVKTGLIGLVRSKSEQGESEGIPYIRMQHFDLDGVWNADKLTRVQASEAERARYVLEEGDVLFNTRNSVELVGKVAICTADQAGALYNNNLLRLRFTGDVLPRFAFRQMQAPVFRRHLENQKSATTSVAAIYQGSLFRTPFWVPPLGAQQQIVDRIDAAFAEIDRLSAEADAAHRLLERLDQAVLAKAFRGQLVPQVPTDEPASALLDRIRAERAAAPKPKRGQRAAA